MKLQHRINLTGDNIKGKVKKNAGLGVSRPNKNSPIEQAMLYR